MFKLVVYDLNARFLEQRFFLTEPDQLVLKTYSREMVAKYGLKIQIFAKEVNYLEMGQVQ